MLHYIVTSLLYRFFTLSLYHFIYMKTIGLCSDHAGFELKEYVRGWLEAKGWPYKDYGTYSTEAATIPTLPINWRKLSRQANVTRELLSAAAETVST